MIVLIQVWFRKGIKDCSSSKNSADYLKGTGWLRMVNEMKMISVGPQDKVTFICVHVLVCVSVHMCVCVCVCPKAFMWQICDTKYMFLHVYSS